MSMSLSDLGEISKAAASRGLYGQRNYNMAGSLVDLDAVPSLKKQPKKVKQSRSVAGEAARSLRRLGTIR